MSTGMAVAGLVAGYDRGHPVLDGPEIEVRAGETVGLAGPSGCGKSTLARVLTLLLPPFAGTVRLGGAAVSRFRYRAARELRVRVGVVFQQPRLSVDPRMTLRRAMAEPLRAAHAPRPDARVQELAELVGLTTELLDRRRTRSATASCNAPASRGHWPCGPTTWCATR